jgi:hypothetical protein
MQLYFEKKVDVFVNVYRKAYSSNPGAPPRSSNYNKYTMDSNALFKNKCQKLAFIFHSCALAHSAFKIYGVRDP